MEDQMSAGFLSVKDVIKITRLSRTTIYRMVVDGRFPKPVSPTGSRRIAWHIDDVRAYLEACQPKETKHGSE
jgi:prophage regulatory protein